MIVKQQVPVQVVLGGGEYAQIKTQIVRGVRKEGQPVAVCTNWDGF